jgi:hypothetical protein
VPGKVIGEVLDRHVAMMKYAAEAYVERVARYRSAGL